MGKENISEKYTFCFATQEDIPELVRMRLQLQKHMEQVNNLLLRYKNDWKNELPLLYEKHLNNSNVVIIKAMTTEVNGVVGMMVGTLNEHPQFTIERSVKIDDVWVDKEHRNKGVCSQMLSKLLKHFSAQGIEHFNLNYVVNNREAEKTWQALGFTPTIINNVLKIIDEHQIS